jgi:hypothetical protein
MKRPRNGKGVLPNLKRMPENFVGTFFLTMDDMHTIWQSLMLSLDAFQNGVENDNPPPPEIVGKYRALRDRIQTAILKPDVSVNTERMN